MAPTKRPQDGGEVVQGVAVVNTVKVLGGEVIPVVADNSSVVVGTVFSSPYQSLWYGASPSTFCDIGAERFRCDVEEALDYCLHRAVEPGSSLKSDKEWGCGFVDWGQIIRTLACEALFRNHTTSLTGG